MYGLSDKPRLKYRITARLSEYEYQAIVGLAETLGVSKSEALRRIIRFALMLDPVKVMKHLGEVILEEE